MSQEERITQLEEQPEKLTEPKVECFFCIDRDKHNFWHFTTVTDKLIREHFTKDGIGECNHEEVNESSIWFADFMATSLLGYVFDNHLERQTDVAFLNETVRDGTIMIPAMEKSMIEHIEEFPLEVFGEPGDPSREFIKEKRRHHPSFMKMAKKMYEKNNQS